MENNPSNEELKKRIQELENKTLEFTLAEKALRENARKFHAVFERSLDAVFLADPQTGNILDANPAASKLLKLPHKKIVGVSQSRIYPPKTWQEAEKTFQRFVQKKGTFHSIETHVHCSDGSEKPVELQAYLVPVNGNQVVLEIFRDIEDRKLAEQALKESRLKYRTLVENESDGIAIIQQGKFKYCNPGLSAISGYSVEELIGTSFSTYTHPDLRPNVVEAYRRQQLGKEVTGSYESLILGKDGKNIDVECNAAPIQYDGKPAVLVILRDITRRKQMEKALVKIQKIESVAVLAGGIAHDFNNMLTAILTNLSMVKTYGDQDQEIVEMVTLAENAALRAKGLTHQLLSVSKGGKRAMKRFHIRRLLQETTGYSLSGSNVGCEFNLPEDLWPVVADEGQIGQVLQNLIVNASQSMPGGGKIRISGRNAYITEESSLPLEPGPYVHVWISDQGSGIPEEYLQRIFDPFFTTKEEGKGLGLATSLSIVLNHKGHIHVESDLGAGTTFDIYLPASEGNSEVIQETAPATRQGTGKVLLVDDDEMIRKATGQGLKRLGYEVSTVKDGEEGIRAYRRAMEKGDPFTVVVMDLTVRGGMGGKDFIQKMMEMDPGANVVVSSGYPDDPVLLRWKEHGFTGALTKPYRLEEIGDVLEKALNVPDKDSSS